MTHNRKCLQCSKKLYFRVTFPDPAKLELLKKLYCAHVIQVDEHTREFFVNLGSLGLLDNTVIIITTDRGDEFGDIVLAYHMMARYYWNS